MMPWMLMLMLVLACGDKDTDTTADTADDTSDDVLVCDEVSWDEERSADFMSSCVLPEMTALFQEFDAEEYGDFSCTSCHGEDLGGGSYAMPGAVAISVREQDPGSDLYQFMYGSVMPTMAGIIGREAYDAASGEGDFSCYDCHQQAR